MARIQQYLLKVGLVGPKIRFRQHLPNEMAHYACDCWDAEALTSYGWVECVGCADRSAYDLTCHARATGTKLCVERPLPVPVTKDVCVPVFDKGLIGKFFKKDAKAVTDALMDLSPDQVVALDGALAQGKAAVVPGTTYEVTRDMVPRVKTETRGPVTKDVCVPVTNNPEIRKYFNKKQYKEITAIFKEGFTQEQMELMQNKLNIEGSYRLPGTNYTITNTMVTSYHQETRQVLTETFIPHVIEPSFGMDRILYVLLEHTFRVREEDKKRTYFSLAPWVAPIKVAIIPLSQRHKREARPFIRAISEWGFISFII
ncbi:hypothetical protein HAZT_HAZT011240 [Hyalella azteca]|uniref:Aminoacyl-transfer RNA synthetases class-II family profile domain-containing protein n=1 Tax=Hyalella azteca TaxID=294128 RepID=A0A6A0GPX6_HYAAZ|nr:hypothetical protein HAZT_HAZT011240 [Hyalella azteca]